MKKTVGTIVLLAVFFSAGSLLARGTTAKEKKAEIQRRAHRRAVNQARKRINNFQWQIEVSPLSGEGSGFEDSITFSDNKFSSEKYSSKGFAKTNYTVNIKDNGTIVFETMQAKDTGEVVFWRGEISSDVKTMSGVLSYQVTGKSQDYSFKSVGKEIASKVAPSKENKENKEQPQVQPESQPTVASAKEEKTEEAPPKKAPKKETKEKPKKRGFWW